MVAIIKVDYSTIHDEASYVDQPVETFEQAANKVYGHRHYGCDFTASFYENRTVYHEINRETGEVVSKWIVQEIRE